MASDSLFRQKAPGIMNLLMADFALDVESAAAILGNLGHESGGFKDLQEKKPLIPGSAGGWGWAQWTGPRRRAFEAYVDRNNLDPASDTANYKYLFLELKGLEGDEARAIPAVKAAVGLREKVIAFELAFERAHKDHKHYESRVTWAQRALDAYRDNPDGKIDVRDGGSSGTVTPIVIPPKVDPSVINPVAGVINFLQEHADQAHKVTLTVVGIHNALYPANQILVQAPKPVTQKPISERPSIAVGLLGLLGSLGLMGSDVLGTPFGMGQTPTGTGTAAVALSAATTILGLFGGFGPIAKIALPLVGKTFGRLAGIGQPR